MTKFIYTLILVCFCFNSFAQIEVSIRGTVKDIKGEPIIGASIFLEETSLGAISNERGDYQINRVTPGSYNITAQYLGFKTVTKFNVIIKSKGKPTINFILEEELNRVVCHSLANSKYLKRSKLKFSQLVLLAKAQHFC